MILLCITLHVTLDNTLYNSSCNSWCNSYSGRPTSLVIDFGAQATRIIPIIDGFTLNKAIVSTSRGGNWIDAEVRKEIDKSGINRIKNKWFEFVMWSKNIWIYEINVALKDLSTVHLIFQLYWLSLSISTNYFVYLHASSSTLWMRLMYGCIT